jgi:DNA-binding NarL/FixJ family response regulator
MALRGKSYSELTTREQAARELRAEGLLLREIGERMGVSLKTVHSWLSDPGGRRLRARKESYRGSCIDCGAPTYGGDGAPHDRCQGCNTLHAAERQRAMGERRAREILRLRREGLLNTEIAERLGICDETVARSMGRLRKRGEDIPRSPHFVDDRVRV